MPRRKKIAAATRRGVTGESGMFQVRGGERLQERQKGTPAPHPTLCVRLALVPALGAFRLIHGLSGSLGSEMAWWCLV